MRSGGTGGSSVVLARWQPGDPPLPVELQVAAREWAVYAATVARSGQPDEVDLVRRRGRQLAARVAATLGRPVDFIDPVTGRAELIGIGPTEPVRVTAAAQPEPTPWATGLSVAAFFAVFAALADLTLCRGLADTLGLFWIPANLLATAGLAPSLYLLRRVPFWRWPALGTSTGLAAAWAVLLLGLLGPR